MAQSGLDGGFWALGNNLCSGLVAGFMNVFIFTNHDAVLL